MADYVTCKHGVNIEHEDCGKCAEALKSAPLYTAAQLSQAVEATQKPLQDALDGVIYALDKHCRALHFKPTTAVNVAELVELILERDEERIQRVQFLERELESSVKAAQGAMIEVAAQIVKQVGKRAALDFPNDLGNHASRTCDHIEESIRALQTEPMAAALAARDKQIRTEAAKLELDAAVENIRELSHIPLHIRQEIITYVCRCSPLIAAARKETP